MAWRDRAWYIQAIEKQQAAIAETRAKMDASIESGEYSMAQLHCDTLRAQLGSLNQVTNEFADKFGG